MPAGQLTSLEFLKALDQRDYSALINLAMIKKSFETFMTNTKNTLPEELELYNTSTDRYVMGDIQEAWEYWVESAVQTILSIMEDIGRGIRQG